MLLEVVFFLEDSSANGAPEWMRGDRPDRSLADALVRVAVILPVGNMIATKVAATVTTWLSAGFLCLQMAVLIPRPVGGEATTRGDAFPDVADQNSD